MADATTTTATPAKKTRKAFTRTPKPTFAIVTYTNAEGVEEKLNKDNLKIVLESDSAKVVDLLTAGAGNATVVRVELPQAKKSPAATPTA